MAATTSPGMPSSTWGAGAAACCTGAAGFAGAAGLEAAAFAAAFKGIRAKLRAGDPEAVADAKQVVKTYNLLGLFKCEPKDFIAYYEQKQKAKEGAIPQEVLDLVEQRKVAKANKDWASADAIRAKINELGYVVKDTKDGSFAEKAE